MCVALATQYCVRVLLVEKILLQGLYKALRECTLQRCDSEQYGCEGLLRSRGRKFMLVVVF